MKKTILLLAFLLLPQIAQAQGWGGWSRLWQKSGNTISQANPVDTVKVTNFRFGESQTEDYVLTVDARGVVTAAEVSAVGAGDITAVTAGTGLGGGGTTGAVTLNAIGSDGVKADADTLRVLRASASGLEFVNGATAVDSLRIDIDGTTLSLSSAGIKIPTGGVTNTEISNNTIVNADINSSAAIVGTKLASNTITDTQINWAQQNADSVFSALPTKMKQIAFKFSFLDTVLVGDSVMVAHEPYAFTIDSIWVTTNTGTVTIFFDHRAHTTPRTRGTNIETSGMVADDYEVSTAFDDATIPANAPVFLRITAVADDPKQLWGTIFARKD